MNSASESALISARSTNGAGASSWSERHDIGCVLVNSAVECAAILHDANAALGVRLPDKAGAFKTARDRVALWLTPRSWLVQCAIGDEEKIEARVSAAFPDKLVHAALFADALGWFSLDGADWQGLLSDGGFISLEPDGLPVGHSKRTLLAGIAAVVMRKSDISWLIGVERSRVSYFADWLHRCSAMPMELRLRSPGGCLTEAATKSGCRP